MRLVVIKESKIHFNRFIDWLIHMVAYTVILLLASLIFKKTLYIDTSYFGIWAMLASVIIYLLNKTVKPILFWLTLPITGVTLGLFYPFINVFILYITDWILVSHFEIHGILFACIVAILISVLNVLMDIMIIEPILDKGRGE